LGKNGEIGKGKDERESFDAHANVNPKRSITRITSTRLEDDWDFGFL
jgi:hypothetical protein